ncbi:MAG: glucose-6-phosphate dehydrogenase [Vicinamibacterales bacterium]
MTVSDADAPVEKGLSRPEAATIVIFGGAGDLAHRKLLPALYNLHVDGLLPERVAVVGVGRKTLTDDDYRAFARGGIEQFSRRPIEAGAWAEFARSLAFVSAEIDGESGLARLGARLDTIEHERDLTGNRVYYCAVPPSLFAPTVRQLARARFVAPPGASPWARIVVEKPIGHDLASARAIDDAILGVFAESQIFRIDHYLGKETVQNILVLRFANSIFEPLFNQHFIDHVQITVAEEEGVGTRAGYYEQAGALRDMVQNHLLQLLALVAMEPPHSLDPEAIRDEKLQVLQSLRPLNGAGVDRFVVRGQYDRGDGAGSTLPAYRDESGVAPGSRTETFVALQAHIDNWRWAGVPFFLRTGKRLPKRVSEIAVFLKEVPAILFNSDAAHPLAPNVLTIRIQPDESFSFAISSKAPGPRVRIEPVEMEFDYCTYFKSTSPEAYERLLLDVLAGDATLFMRRDSVEASWRWITPILERWSEQADNQPDGYPAGTAGPVEADALIGARGRQWRAL